MFILQIRIYSLIPKQGICNIMPILISMKQIEQIPTICFIVQRTSCIKDREIKCFNTILLYQETGLDLYVLWQISRIFPNQRPIHVPGVDSVTKSLKSDTKYNGRLRNGRSRGCIFVCLRGEWLF